MKQCFFHLQDERNQAGSWVESIWNVFTKLLMQGQIRRDRARCHFHLHLLASDIGEWVLYCWDAAQGENGSHYKVPGSRSAINQNADSIQSRHSSYKSSSVYDWTKEGVGGARGLYTHIYKHIHLEKLKSIQNGHGHFRKCVICSWINVGLIDLIP